MRIILNGVACEVRAQTLDQILLEHGYDSPFIATAVNGLFVNKHKRAETELKEGDRLELVAPIEGG